MRYAMLPLLALALSAQNAAAQITLEHTYAAGTNDVVPFRTSAGAVKYAAVPSSRATVTVDIYNDDHTVDRQITVSAPAGSKVTAIDYVSDQLFDLDNSTYELIVQSYDTVSFAFSAAIVSQSGTTMLDLSNVAPNEFSVITTGAGAKLVVQPVNAANGRVYGLPGTYYPLRVTGLGDDVAAERMLTPYPNPTTGTIRLPYQLKAGSTAPLTVLDATGRVARTLTVGSAFSDVVLDTQALPAGVYTYRVGEQRGRFVVTK